MISHVNTNHSANQYPQGIGRGDQMIQNKGSGNLRIETILVRQVF